MVNITPLTWASAPGPARTTSWLTLASREPRPPTVHWMRGVAADDGALPAEVPGGVVPVLDVDQPEPRPCARKTSSAPACRAGPRLAPRAGRLADQRGLGPVLEHDERVVQVDAALPGQADQAEQRGLELHALRHVEQRPAGPERRVQRREEVVGRA